MNYKHIKSYNLQSVINALASVERKIPEATQIKKALEYPIILSKPTKNALGNIVTYTLSNYDEKKANIAISLFFILNTLSSCEKLDEMSAMTENQNNDSYPYNLADLNTPTKSFPIFKSFISTYIQFLNQHKNEYLQIKNNSLKLKQVIMRGTPTPNAHIDETILHSSLWSINRNGTIMYEMGEDDVFKKHRQPHNVSKSLGNLPRNKVDDEIYLIEKNNALYKQYQIPRNQVVTFFGGLSKEHTPAIHKSPNNTNNKPIYELSENVISKFILKLNALPKLKDKNQILTNLSYIPINFADNIESDGKLFVLETGGQAKDVKKI